MGIGIEKDKVGLRCEGVKSWVYCDELRADVDNLLLNGGLFADRCYPFNPVALDFYCRSEFWGALECAWGAVLAVPQGMQSEWLEAFEADTALVEEFLQVDRMGAYIDGECYTTPQEVCAANWRSELESAIERRVEECEEPLVAYPGKLECVAAADQEGDVFFSVPSKLFREALGVSSCDGKVGFNEVGVPVFEYRDSGDLGDEVIRQGLYADKEQLCAALSKNGLTLCWMLRFLRRPALEYEDHAGKDYFESDRLLFAYGDGDGLYVQEIYRKDFPSSQTESSRG